MGVVDLDKRRLEPAPPQPKTWRTRLSGVLREPLLHFFVVGLVVFLAAQGWRGAHDARRIVITPERIVDLSTKYRMQFGTPPSRTQLDQLIDGYVEEEVLYREGVAQHLDRNDEIVRRRVAQKAQFLVQDTPPADPTDAQLRAFYDSHTANYGSPPRYSFSHLYFSPEPGGDAAAYARAQAALTRLNAGVTPDAIAADAFLDLNNYAAVSTAEVARIFGTSPFTQALPTAPVGHWSGPFHSGYGWHVLKVEAAMPAKVSPFDQIREKVRADYFEDAHDKAGDRALAAARSRYTVVRADLKARP